MSDPLRIFLWGAPAVPLSGPHPEADDLDTDEESQAACLDCGVVTGLADFQLVDDVFEEAAPRCPACQQAVRLRCARCEFCDEPAEFEVELGFLCSEHHDHYVDGYRARE